MIPYITRVFNLNERLTEAMEEGSNVDKDVVLQFIYPILKVKEVIKKPLLISKKFKAMGSPDFLIQTVFNVWYILDVKDTDKKNRDHRVQVYYYALLAEENGYRVKEVMLYYTKLKELMRLPYGEDERDYALRVLKEIRDTISNGYPPRVIQKAVKCENCGFRVYCKPRIKGSLAHVP